MHRSEPLFPDEKELALRVVGPKRAKAWREIVRALEKRGFPKINPIMGGRYWPAVVAFFERDSGLGASDGRFMDRPFAPDGVEDFSAEARTNPRKPRS